MQRTLGRSSLMLLLAVLVLVGIQGCRKTASDSATLEEPAAADAESGGSVYYRQSPATVENLAGAHEDASESRAAGSVDGLATLGPREEDSLGSNGEPDLGHGPGQGGDRYEYIEENPFVAVATAPLSTFSIDVDTASYSKTRMCLMQQQMLPPPGAVRIEEFINYFAYDYPDPEGEHPFGTNVEVATCPWQPAHRLVRVGLQGRRMQDGQRPAANLVFLLDVSGSMNESNKLPLVKQAIRLLTEQLNGDDRVAIVVYASATGRVLDSTSAGNPQAILSALDSLQAGGSTNGGAGIELAYRTARENLLEDGINRVILCTDGDFNVGVTSTSSLVELAAQQAESGVFLSVLGFGMGNHNDAMLEELSNRANGQYTFIDTPLEARKVMVDQLSGTLFTIAKDVKIQVEFNPGQVHAYRLIGYENRLLRDEDFADDKKDAGEIGAGHQVTALYEVVPVGAEDSVDLPEPSELRYQSSEPVEDEALGQELLTVNLRYKLPEGDTSTPLSVPVVDIGQTFAEASPDFRFAASVAGFGMLLRKSHYAGQTSYGDLLDVIAASLGEDRFGYRGEFQQLVRQAQALGPAAAPADDAPEAAWQVSYVPPPARRAAPRATVHPTTQALPVQTPSSRARAIQTPSLVVGGVALFGLGLGTACLLGALVYFLVFSASARARRMPPVRAVEKKVC